MIQAHVELHRPTATLEASFLGLLLVTCDADNRASVQVIERNHGVLEDERTSLISGKLIRRYWVAVPNFR